MSLNKGECVRFRKNDWTQNDWSDKFLFILCLRIGGVGQPEGNIPTQIWLILFLNDIDSIELHLVLSSSKCGQFESAERIE